MDSAAEAWAAHAAGDGRAVELFARARAEFPNRPELLIGQAEARLQSGEPDPLADLSAVVARNPQWAAGHSALASLRWEAGEQDQFADPMRSALKQNPLNAPLWNAYIAALAGVQDFGGAAEAAREAQLYFDVPILRLIEANHAGMAGDLDRVDSLLATVPDDLPDRWSVEVRHFIRKGQLGDAAGVLDRLRESQPADLSHWALTDVVWRALGDARSEWLSGQPGLIEQIEIPVSDAELNELAELLRQLHWQARSPMAQSVRGGTQTRGRLLDRGEAPLRRLRTLLEEAVDQYRRDLPPADPGHPLLRQRERSVKPDGGWSVRLEAAGHHVPHLHPAGTLSSACYIVVPELDAATREGWLELGRPPADLRLDLEPLASVEPRPGMLALFPSYLYHGTRPFRAGERISVAFDAS